MGRSGGSNEMGQAGGVSKEPRLAPRARAGGVAEARGQGQWGPGQGGRSTGSSLAGDARAAGGQAGGEGQREVAEPIIFIYIHFYRKICFT